MPYISTKDCRREKLRNGEIALNAGELNYQIFYYFKHTKRNWIRDLKNIKKFVDNFLGKTPNYQKYNDITGAIYRCNKEIIRRLDTGAYVLIAVLKLYDDEIEKYEDLKIIENGDVE